MGGGFCRGKETKMDIRPSEVLTWGIVAAATAQFGITGIIFGAIGRTKAREYVAAHGTTTGQVKAGSITSNVGFIAGIIMTGFWGIFFTIMIFAIIFG